jgi:anti-sigma factor RsiW
MGHTHTPACQDLKSQLSSFIDGELDDAICQEIMRHLESCENCRVMVDTLKKTIVLYREEPHESVSSQVHNRLFNVLDLEALKSKEKK